MFLKFFTFYGNNVHVNEQREKMLKHIEFNLSVDIVVVTIRNVFLLYLYCTKKHYYLKIGKIFLL